jgi:hypothetical protein
MAGLVPAIHVFSVAIPVKAWMPGTSPGMTSSKGGVPSPLARQPERAFHHLDASAADMR